jgi:ribosomal protein L11 methyltransferase
MARLPAIKPKPLTEVTLVTSHEAEDAAAELLQRLFDETASIYTSREKLLSAVTVYLERTPRELKAFEEKIRDGFDEIEMYGLDTHPAEIRIAKVKREDWAESWKKYFKTIRVGKQLLIKPSWSKEKPAKGQAAVVLDPGLSFGTGQHPTTGYCLKQIVARWSDELRESSSKRLPNRPSLLDIGCGSGILAISAAKLGYSPVEALDFDPVAVRIAQANLRRNRVAHKVACRRQDLTKLPLHSGKKFNVICANLVADLLISESTRIINRLASNGRLIVAGILATQFKEVQRAFEKKGLRLLDTQTEREWQSGLFGVCNGEVQS